MQTANMSSDISSTIKFRDICNMLERIKKATLPRKELILRRYYESFLKHRNNFRQQSGLNGPENGTSSFYCILRLLLPKSDMGRESYGLQTTALGRLYTRVLQLPTDSRDALRLQYRGHSSVRGDYADIVYSVLLSRCHHNPSDLTLKQVHEMLDIIATEDTKIKERELIGFSEIASAEEQKWLIRILLKSMNLSFGMQRVFAMLHPMAEKIYQHCANLERLCKLLADDKMTLEASCDEEPATTSAIANQQIVNIIEPFELIRPMLCERFPGKIEELMEADVLYMETKMDGERFQLHFVDGRFKYISRNGVDYTSSFGANYQTGTLSPKLRNLLPISLQSIIIDGEMMIWDTIHSRFRDKGENTDVKHLNPDRGWQPCFIAYDLLYLNGKSLLNMPYVQRTYKLQDVLKEETSVFQIVKPKKIGSLDEFNTLFQEVLDSNAEGIVLKKQNSIYRPGVRNGGGWYKDKADYIKGLTTEFDVLIIGGFYNRKRTFIKSFLLGVLKPAAYINGQQHNEVYSIGKVLNNTRDRAVLNHTLRSHWQDINSEPPPIWYHYKHNNSEGRPDVWIEPKNSIILQVKAADLAPYSAFYTTKSLHFPRTEAWRKDKVWNECMTLQEFIQLCQGKVGLKKINKRQLSLEDFTDDRKRQKLTLAQKRNLGILTYEKRFDADVVPTSSTLFKGFSFCILSGSPRRRYTKLDLQNLAARNGGTIVANPLPNNANCICVAGDITYLVERHKLKQPLDNDIVKMDWLLKVCDKQEIHLRPKDMIAATESLKAQFAKSFDRFGDSYTDYIMSVDEMKELLADINDAELINANIDEAQITQFEKELMGNKKSYNFFRNHKAYFYEANLQRPSMKSKMQLSKILFEQHGGQSLKDFDGNPQYIFINLNNFNQNDFNDWLKDQQQQINNRIQRINVDWINQSDELNRCLDINDFVIS